MSRTSGLLPITLTSRVKNGLSMLVLSGLSMPLIAQTSVIDEVVVTAQKRSQSLQDVSVAVSAFSGDAIEQMGFEEGLDITQQVPNMNFFAIFGEASSPSVSLRGISLVNFSDSWESPVSIYVDDVYRGNPAGSAIQLFDLERVEVLRGPQGTLYGRNTTGGLVHYVSRKPTHELESSASVRLGSYNERIVEGTVSGPISDSVRARLALRSNKNDGWQTNVVTGNDLNQTDTFGYRGQLEIDLNKAANLLLNVHGSEADQASVGFAHMGYLQTDLATTCSINRIQSGKCTSATFEMTGEEAANGKFGPEHVASSASGGLLTQIDTAGSSATLNWDFDSFQLTSVTAYEELDKFLQDDGDGTPVIFFDEQYSVDAEQFTQELRLNGATSQMEWVTGVYYYKDQRDLATQAPTTADGPFYHEEIVALDTTSWAAFGQAELDLTQQLTLVTGLRYTDEDRNFQQTSDVSFYTPRVTGVERSLSEDAWTGRIGLDWRPVDGTLAYASLSTGFKSGGFSGSYNPNLAATRPVTSEDVTNLEFGLKTAFMDNRVRFNGAIFAYENRDFQAQVFQSVELGSIIINAGDVTGMGAEAEVTAQVSENIELIAGAGWLDTEFDSDQVFEVAEDFYAMDGNELPSAPELTFNFVARYYLGLATAGSMIFQVDYAWQDDHFLQIENDPYSRHDSYGIANAKISWHSPEETFTVEAFVENATDEEYFTYQNTLGDDWGYAVWGKPRWAGARVAVNF